MRRLALIATLLLFPAAACKKEADAGEGARKVPRVGVATLALQEWQERVDIPATVTPAATVNVIAKVPGRLKEVRADEGAEVAAGDVIAALDTRDIEIALRAAAGQAAMARAGLEAARVQRDNLARDLKRVSELRKTGSVSVSEAEKLEAAFKAAEAQVGVAEAQVRVAEAGYQAARKNLSDATVTAPIAGVVVKRMFDVGQETAPTAGPLVVLASVDPVRVEGTAPESVMSRVRPGDPAVVRLDALPGQEFSGKVELVGPAVDPLAKSVRIRVLVGNPPEGGRRRIAPGMSAVISLTPEKGRYFVLPLNAVRRQEGDFVALLLVGPDSRLIERKVRPLRKEGLRFLALDGLSEGDRLVVAAPADLEPGALVEPTGLADRRDAPGGTP